MDRPPATLYQAIMRQWLLLDGWDLATAGFASWAIVVAGLGRLDHRRLDGENTWSKPFRFALSLTVHFATFAVLARCLPPSRNGAALLSTLAAALAAAVLAQSYITIQAARRRRSHFNTTTPVEAALIAVTGLCAVVVLAPAIIIGLDALFAPLPAWAAAARVGVAMGLLGGAPLTVVTGFYMGSVGSHFPGRPPKSPRRMKITGWSLNGPDLRPAHFLANHMMQAVPLAGAGFALLLAPLPALLLTLFFGSAWVWVTLATLQSAISGKPLARPVKVTA